MRATLLLLAEPLFAEPLAELLEADEELLGRGPGREPLDLPADDAEGSFFEDAVFVRSPLNGNGFESSFA